MHDAVSAYDKNGNLTQDLNKNILQIEYNALNLPCEVTFGNGNTVSYLYSAGGTKLRTVHKTGNTTATTDYVGNVVYENNSPKLLLTDAGYVSLSDGKYHYYLKDHQGNNRVVINQSGTVEEVNHYYPFGGVFASSGNVQPYKYNGKELDRKNGLDWYDYGARHYDAALGRFLTRDPLANKYWQWSPYAYCLDNPVRYVDPDGRKIVIGTFWQRLGAALGMKIDFIEKVSKQFEQNNAASSEIKSIYQELEKSDLVFKVLPLSESPEGSDIGIHVISDTDAVLGEGQGATLYYDPDMKVRADGQPRDPRIALAHELGHLKDFMDGNVIPVDKDKFEAGDNAEKAKMVLNERTSLATENEIRKVLGYELREKFFEEDKRGD